MVDADERQRWNRRYRARDEVAPVDGPPPDPPAPLRRLATVLPARGTAIDLAGGDGGGALFLAHRGLATTVVDLSDVGLRRAAAFAARDGIELRTVAADLSGRSLREVLTIAGEPRPDVVTCFNYLDRTLLGSVSRDLPSGSRFVAAVATTTNLERHRRPPARFLLDPGELARLVVGDRASRLRVLHRREGWADDRHRAEIAVEAR